MPQETEDITIIIEILKKYCKENPYLFNRNLKKQYRDKLKKDNNLDAIEEFNKINDLYFFIIDKKRKNELTEGEITDLRESKIGGVFGLSEDDRKLNEKYGISCEVISELYKKFGSIDNFRKLYIQYKIDLSKAKCDEEEKQIKKGNKDILKYANRLPLIDNFYLCSNSGYNALANEILENSSNNLIFDSDIKNVLNSIMNSKLNDRAKKILKLRFGIGNSNTKKIALENIGKIIGNSRQRISDILNVSIKKIKGERERLEEHIYRPDEEFVKNYFEVHDIFYSNNEKQMSKDMVEELVGRFRENEKDKKTNEKEKLKDLYKKATKIKLEEIGLSTRAYNILNENNINSLDKILKVMKDKRICELKGLGKQTKNDIINKVCDLVLQLNGDDKDAIKIINPEDVKTEDSDIGNASTENLKLLIEILKIQKVRKERLDEIISKKLEYKGEK